MRAAPLMGEQCRLDTLVDKYRNNYFYFKLILILKVSVMSVIVN